jgi:phosphoenolpyruvate-protein phosphotransferase (PTS system enzyme I)
MVETPSCVLLADHLIKHCDFFSIGSNDLTQYSVAVDRGNTELLELFDTFNPAILRLINITIKASHEHNKWTGICGEFASDINGALILVGMGVDELSMSANFIPQIKEIICKVSYKDLKQLATEVLDHETSAEIINHINKFKEANNV